MRPRRWRCTRWRAGRGAAQRGLAGEVEGRHGGPGDGGEDVVSQVGVPARMRASATPPSARCTTTRSPLRFSTANGGRPTSRSTSGSLRSPPRAPPTTPPCGCTITSCSWCRPICASARCVRIGPSTNVPFPGYELFAQLPWRRQLVQGMLGTHLIGFSGPADATTFLRACTRVAPNSRAPGVHALSAPPPTAQVDARARASDGTYKSGCFRSRRLHPSRSQN